MRIFFCFIITGIISQVSYLGVFASESWYVVIRDRDQVCGNFTPWNSESPNWLWTGWRAVDTDPELAQKFRATASCEAWNIARCCRDNGYKYAWVPIWVPQVSEARKSAEFLASKGIIEKQYLSPDAYRLDDPISRKEMMKIVSQTASLPRVACRNSFSDVVNDWACAYIEAALMRWFIARNENFRPEAYISQAEALKLLLQARNIGKRFESNSWQRDYASTALYLWLTDLPVSDYNFAATRWWIFQVLARSYGESFRNW